MKNPYHYIMGCLCVIIIVLISSQIYHMKDTYGLKCIISTKDGNRYCVRDRKNIDDAVELLSLVVNKCIVLVQRLNEDYHNWMSRFEKDSRIVPGVKRLITIQING